MGLDAAEPDRGEVIALRRLGNPASEAEGHEEAGPLGRLLRAVGVGEDYFTVTCTFMFSMARSSQPRL